MAVGPMITFKPDYVQVDSLIKRLQEHNKRFVSLRPAMIKVARFIRMEMTENFDTEGAYSGDRWAPNQETYASWKRGERSGGVGGSWLRPAKSSRVLHRYLELRRALTVKAHPDHVEEVGPKGRWVRVGVDPGSKAADLVRIHNAGGGGRFPVREAMRLRRPAFDRTIIDIVEEYVRGKEDLYEAKAGR